MKVGSSYLKADCHDPLPTTWMPDQTILVAKGLVVTDGASTCWLAGRQSALWVSLRKTCTL